MERVMIKTAPLNSIGECLEQLLLVEESLIAIDGQLLKDDADPAWRKRAQIARRTIGQKKRIITARLAILRHEEKERNLQLHQQHNDFLIQALREIVTPSSFERCVRLSKEKVEEIHANQF